MGLGGAAAEETRIAEDVKKCSAQKSAWGKLRETAIAAQVLINHLVGR